MDGLIMFAGHIYNNNDHARLILIWIVMFSVIAVAMFWLSYWTGRRILWVKLTPTSKIRSAAQGFVELTGAAHGSPSGSLLSPLTKTECAWWYYSIEKSGQDSAGNTQSTIVEKLASGLPFVLKDETGECQIDPEGLEKEQESLQLPTRYWSGKTCYPPESSKVPSAFDQEGFYMYAETIIPVGATIYALGQFETSYRQSGDPEGVHRLSKPKSKSHPFIITTESEVSLQSTYFWYSLVFFLIALGSSAQIVWAIDAMRVGPPTADIAQGFLMPVFQWALMGFCATPLILGIRRMRGRDHASMIPHPAATESDVGQPGKRWSGFLLILVGLVAGAVMLPMVYLFGMSLGMFPDPPAPLMLWLTASRG